MSERGECFLLEISKSRLLWFILLVGLIVCSNVLIYHIELFQPVPQESAIGTLFDFVIVIPILTYFLIIRKRLSIKYLIIVCLLGLFFAKVIIPNELQSNFSFFVYFIYACEGIFSLVELYFGLKLLKNISKIIKGYRNSDTEIPTFQYKLNQAIQHQVVFSRPIAIFVSEITMIYYSLFAWKKKPQSIFENHTAFTYHKKTSSVALNIMLIHALILESVGVHFLIHSWSPLFSIITLILNVYTLLFVIAEIQAIRLCPFIITDHKLYLQVGLSKNLTVPFEKIKSIHYYQGPDKRSKSELKSTFDGLLPDFSPEKPTIEIEFFQPLSVNLLYGFKKKVFKAHLRPDDPHTFYELLSMKVKLQDQISQSNEVD